MRAVGLPARCRVGTKPFAVKPEPVAPAVRCLGVERRKVSVRVARHGDGALGAPVDGGHDQFHTRDRRGPDAHLGAAAVLHIRTDRQPAPQLRSLHRLLTPRGQSRATLRRSRPAKRAISAVKTAGSTGLGRS